MCDFERESATEIEVPFDIFLVNFEVVLSELAELVFANCGAGDGEFDCAAVNGDVGVAVESFARHGHLIDFVWRLRRYC